MARQSDLSDWGGSFKKPKEPHEHPIIAWIRRNLIQFIILVAIWIVCLPLVLVGGDDSGGPSGPTRLVQKGGVRRVFAPGEINLVNSLVLSVRNTGQFPAIGIEVSVEVAQKKFDLQGPPFLGPGQSADYSAPVNLYLKESHQITPHVVCDNCR